MRQPMFNENNGFEVGAESFSQRSEEKLQAVISARIGGHAPCPF
jgi:hypothetical protein